MSEAVELNLLGKMVSRLQAGMEGVRQDYAGVRASLTTMDTRFAEFGLRMSSLELAQMKLAASFDDMHGKFDRMEVEFAAQSTRIERMESKLDLILSRLPDR